MRIGTEDFQFEVESKRKLDTVLMLLHVPLFALIWAYAEGYLPFLMFLAAFYLVEIRIFSLHHDRVHADFGKRLPGPLDTLADWMELIVTPWDEPFPSYSAKHLKHHASHIADRVPARDLKSDPHSAFESGGWFKAFLGCLFYEEIQLWLDLRYGNFHKARYTRLAVYAPLIAGFIYFYGWEKYLGVLVSMRIVATIAWYVFSWGFHQDFSYTYDFHRKLPGWLKLAYAALNGRRTLSAWMFHAAHHAYARVPCLRLQQINEIAERNPTAVPKLVPTPV